MRFRKGMVFKKQQTTRHSTQNTHIYHTHAFFKLNWGLFWLNLLKINVFFNFYLNLLFFNCFSWFFRVFALTFYLCNIVVAWNMFLTHSSSSNFHEYSPHHFRIEPFRMLKLDKEKKLLIGCLASSYLVYYVRISVYDICSKTSTNFKASRKIIAYINSKPSKDWVPVGVIKNLHMYPIKSCKPIDVSVSHR